MVNHFYFYGVDRDFGPFFLKFCTYFPYNAKLCINGHEYVKRQLSPGGDRLRGPGQRHPLVRGPRAPAGHLRRPLGGEDRRAAAEVAAAVAPSVHAADRKAGYRYDVSILQAEFSLTQVLDRPVTGRIFFEEVIRENLDIGRPDQVQLIFDRRVRPANARPIPHAGHHRGRHALAARRLQAHPHQAVPQGRPRAAHRDHHQRHARLRHRQAAEEPARAAGGRLSSQPTSPGRPTDQPRLRHGRGRLQPGPAADRGATVNGPRRCASPIRSCKRC